MNRSRDYGIYSVRKHGDLLIARRQLRKAATRLAALLNRMNPTKFFYVLRDGKEGYRPSRGYVRNKFTKKP